MLRAAALALVLFAFGALARPADCMSRCESNQKECQLKCAKAAGKHAASCRSACAQFIEPCKEDCKKKEERRK